MKQFNEYYYNLLQTQRVTNACQNIILCYVVMSYVLIGLSTLTYTWEMFEINSSFNLCLVFCLCMIGNIKEKLEKNIKI